MKCKFKRRIGSKSKFKLVIRTIEMIKKKLIIKGMKVFVHNSQIKKSLVEKQMKSLCLSLKMKVIKGLREYKKPRVIYDLLKRKYLKLFYKSISIIKQMKDIKKNITNNHIMRIIQNSLKIWNKKLRINSSIVHRMQAKHNVRNLMQCFYAWHNLTNKKARMMQIEVTLLKNHYGMQLLKVLNALRIYAHRNNRWKRYYLLNVYKKYLNKLRKYCSIKYLKRDMNNHYAIKVKKAILRMWLKLMKRNKKILCVIANSTKRKVLKHIKSLYVNRKKYKKHISQTKCHYKHYIFFKVIKGLKKLIIKIKEYKANATELHKQHKHLMMRRVFNELVEYGKTKRMFEILSNSYKKLISLNRILTALHTWQYSFNLNKHLGLILVQKKKQILKAWNIIMTNNKNSVDRGMLLKRVIMMLDNKHKQLCIYKWMKVVEVEQEVLIEEKKMLNKHLMLSKYSEQ